MITSSRGVIGTIARSAVTICPTNLLGFSTKPHWWTSQVSHLQLEEKTCVKDHSRRPSVRSGYKHHVSIGYRYRLFHYPRRAAKQWRTVPDMCMHEQWIVVLSRV
jgi:hypothetical protein